MYSLFKAVLAHSSADARLNAGVPDAAEPPWRSFWVERVLYRCIPVAASAIVYGSLLQNYFMSDDFGNMYDIATSSVLEFLLTPHGGHILLFRNAIFEVFYAAFGLDPRWYFLSVLITHLINVYLLSELIRRLTGSPRLACFGATLWGTCPISGSAQGSLAWYSVYGHVLVATIQLLVLNDLLRLAAGGQGASRRRLAGWYVLLLIGVTCFGVGIPVAMTFGVMAFLLLPKTANRDKIGVVFCSLVIIVPALFLGFHRLRMVISGSGANEATAALSHLDNWWPAAVNMLGQLLLYGPSSLAFPYLCGPEEGCGVACYGFVVLFALGIVIALLRSSAPVKRCLLAFLTSVLATYALIAAGRGPLFALFGVPTDWAGMQPRYHYLAPVAIAVILCVLLNELGRSRVFRALPGDLLLALWLIVTLTVYLTKGESIDHHESQRRETESVLGEINAAISGAPDGANVYIPNRDFASIRPGLGTGDFPGWAAVFIISHPSNIVQGKRVRFVETDPRTLAEMRALPNNRLAGLLVAPSEVLP